MTQRESSDVGPVWLGKDAQGGAFEGGGLWFGRHSGDQDILVFDPSEEDSSASVLSLYSLTQHRMRSFPRATVEERIHALTDELGCARARKDYAQRAALRATREQEMAAARDARRDRQREGVIRAHHRYLEALGPAQEVRETAAKRRVGRRAKCHQCGIALDGFAGATCVACRGVLCSCGACACQSPVDPD